MSGEGNSKFTEPRVEAALTALRHGCTRRAAAGAAGVTSPTFYRWMEDVAFRSEVEKAEALAEAAFTSVVAEAAVKSWQAAAWWLERRKSADYGLRQRLDVSTDARRMAERVAADTGMTVDEVLAEADRILAEADR